MGFFDKWTAKVRAAVENPQTYPGTLLRGSVVVETSGQVDANELKVVVQGILHVKQRKQTSGPDQGDDSNGQSTGMDLGATLSAGLNRGKNAPKPKYKDFFTDAPILTQTVTLLGGASGHRAAIGHGTHTYPFELTLPTNIPPSLVQHFGQDMVSMSYTCVGVLCVSMAPDTTSEPVPLTVISIAPRAQAARAPPVALSRSFDIVECFCIDQGKVSANVNADRCVVVPNPQLPGGVVNVAVDVDNTASKAPCNGVNVKLVQILNYYAEGMALNNSQRPAHRRTVIASFMAAPGQANVAVGQAGRVVVPVSIPLQQQQALPPTAQITQHYSCTYALAVGLGHSGITQTIDVPIALFPTVDDTDRAPPMSTQPYQFQQPPVAIFLPPKLKENYGSPGQYHVPGQAFDPSSDAQYQQQQQGV